MKKHIRLSVYTGKIRRFAERIFEKLKNNRESMQYYAILIAILAVLSTAAYSYRSDRTEARDISVPKTDSVIASGNSISAPTQTIEEIPLFLLPVAGEIVTTYTVDRLIWSDDLSQWQTHPAIDISCAAGEAVSAAADGTVAEIYFDALYGNTIVINHGKEGMLLYASLNTLQLVSPGQKVKQGEVISSIGTCAAEASLGAHLHLEWLVNGEHRDPMLLVSE